MRRGNTPALKSEWLQIRSFLCVSIYIQVKCFMCRILFTSLKIKIVLASWRSGKRRVQSPPGRSQASWVPDLPGCLPPALPVLPPPLTRPGSEPLSSPSDLGPISTDRSHSLAQPSSSLSADKLFAITGLSNVASRSLARGCGHQPFLRLFPRAGSGLPGPSADVQMCVISFLSSYSPLWP